ncbi:hypothetical protein EC957_011008 [Mortierella hygrophila]|uniref:Uncharacterized protein n=1 Tax=Mortierella hygrophila TaxID=979708 RepID=A0A9P6K4E7_9FUNG|nr:hypothetical protein EC957_011008 [Mortierella hygrophila]
MKLSDLVDHDEPLISKLVRGEYEEAKGSLLKSGCQPTIKDDTRLFVVHDEAHVSKHRRASVGQLKHPPQPKRRKLDLCINISPRSGKTPKSRQGQAPRASSDRNAQREDHPLLATGGSWTCRSASDGAVPHATTTLSSSSTTLFKEKATDRRVRLDLHSQSLTHKVPVELEDSPELSHPPFFQPTTMVEESDDEERLVRNTRKNRSMQGLDYGSHALGDPAPPYNDICDFDQETGEEMGNIHQDAHYYQGDLYTSVNRKDQ